MEQEVELIPLAKEEDFEQADDLRGIQTIVSLGIGTCTFRAADYFRNKHQQVGRMLNIHTVSSFEDAIVCVRDNLQAALLVPQLHAAHERLDAKSHYQRIASQTFTLPNPALHVASPINNQSDRTYLWTLPTLIPLVEEAYGNDLPFEEIVPARNTQDAAFECSKIFGGAFCVTNQEGVRRYNLASIKQLRHIVMKWDIFRKKYKRRP